jgi:sugar lactone lactonase YvrE
MAAGCAALLAVLAVAACGGAARHQSGPRPNGTATHVTVSAPSGLAIDSQGNLYVAEFGGARVDRIAPDGRLAVIAGSGKRGYAGDSGRAKAARLDKPIGLAVDAHGDVAVADYASNVIRVVTPDGRIRTFVRSDQVEEPIGLAYSGRDLYATDAADGGTVLKIPPSGSVTAVANTVHPGYLAFDSGGNLDLSDLGDNTVLQIAAADLQAGRQNVVTTLAGAGAPGFRGDGGAATSARLNLPLGVALDSKGNLYIADSKNNRVRKINTNGIITTVAGAGGHGGFSGDGGPATDAKLNRPTGLAIDGAGDLYIADEGNNRVRRVDPQGVITTVAGNGRSVGVTKHISVTKPQIAIRPPGLVARPARRVRLSAPEDLTFDRKGNLYVSDYQGEEVLKITPDGLLRVFAGTGTAGYSGNGGPATKARLSGPAGLAVNSRGDLLIADHLNNVIRRVDPSGRITTLSASLKAHLTKPIGLLFRGKELYVADPWHNRLLQINPSGAVHLIVSGSHPTYLSLGPRGNILMTDRDANRLYEVVLHVGKQSALLPIAGTGSAGFTGDGGPATKAHLNVPYGVAMDRKGNIYVADSDNNRVQKISPSGVVTTFAGTGAAGFSGDDGPAAKATLYKPVGLAFDSAGNLYIADQGNGRIRRVDTHGIITTFAGGGTPR